jgi:hypothetical protein
MKFLIALILIILLSFTACLFLPWWTIAIASFAVALTIPLKPGISFLAGFLALFILWGTLTAWISSNNDHILAHKISLLILKTDSPIMLILITALLGAMVAGFAALSGSLLRKTV